MTNGGTLAPLVTPIVRTPSSHSCWISVEKSTRCAAFAPYSSATSTRRTEFEELAEPTTMTRSEPGAIFLIAACRLDVA